MEVVEVLQGMLDRFNRKRELHQRAFTLYKNRDMKVFTIPLMVVQFLCGILPQIPQALPQLPTLGKVISICSSALAAISAIWLGFQVEFQISTKYSVKVSIPQLFRGQVGVKVKYCPMFGQAKFKIGQIGHYNPCGYCGAFLSAVT